MPVQSKKKKNLCLNISYTQKTTKDEVVHEHLGLDKLEVAS